MTHTIHHGDALEVLRTLDDASAQCGVTSPPYWGLRDYGVDGQLGLERTPEEYVSKLVAIFAEVRRVLRDDGVLWLNIGDSYAQSGVSGPQGSTGDRLSRSYTASGACARAVSGLKPKDLVGIPWRVAFALQADGWYLRSDIIWHKPNPMPESVTDRPTKAHEYVFLLCKGQHRTRTVALSDLKAETIHFGKSLGSQRSDSWGGDLCQRIASTLFESVQLQEDFSLPPFYSDEWKQMLDCGSGVQCSNLPPEHRAAAHSARFLNSDTTTKEFLREINALWRHLGDSNPFLKGGRCGLSPANSGGVFVDRDASITVKNAGKVSKIDFLHDQIIVTVPTGCKYFWDQDAVREGYSVPMYEGSDNGAIVLQGGKGGRNDKGKKCGMTNPKGRNIRSVWTVATHAFPDAHFATFPPALVEPMIKAGSRPGDVVLDPFSGAATTGLVSVRLGREYVGIELNDEYVAMGERRLVAEYERLGALTPSASEGSAAPVQLGLLEE